ncbi:MAG: LLM class flavin-dependent oxidoreductase [Endozoicomonas sp.]
MKTHVLVQPYMRSKGEDVTNPGADPERFDTLLKRTTEQMQFADQNGYAGFCMTEHHFQVEGIETTTNPILWNLHIAKHTQNLMVGQVGMALTAHHPLRLAEDLAMLDHMVDGRLFVGFVRGNTPRWLNTLAQHLDITTTQSDRSEADKKNRRLMEESWQIVKKAWTEDTFSYEGEFWQVPPKGIQWPFLPTQKWGGADALSENDELQKIGVVPKPRKRDGREYPPLYVPFSWSMETARFWAKEGAKLVAFVSKDEFIDMTMDIYIEECHKHGHTERTTGNTLVLGGHLTIGSNEAQANKHYDDFENLFNTAYNTPPYNVPMGRVWKGTVQQVIDQVGALKEKYGTEEFVCWHHVGYFEQEEELEMLDNFAQVIKAFQ